MVFSQETMKEERESFGRAFATENIFSNTFVFTKLP